jgi:trk system potassium uptake protein TrkH
LAFQQPWNALFESFSGFTDTGLSVAVSPSQLPYSLQWWRSFTEWVGGVGVIVLMLSILRPGAGMHQLYYSEGREEKILPSVRATVRAIWWIYVLYTLLSVLLLRLVGMPWWPAINYGLTSLATGGFGMTDHSIGDYGLGVRLAVMLIMLVGATSFAVHYQVLRRRHWQVLWQDEQHQALWWMVGLGSLVLFIENYWSQGLLLWIDTFFQWISALSTTGLQSVDFHLWSPTSQLLLSFAMFVGGAAGSTAGGLKQIRLVFLAKGVGWRLRRIMLPPHAVMRYQVNREGLSESEATRLVEAAGILATLWAVLFWGGVLVLLHVVPERFTLSDVIFEIASAQGNVGLSIGITHPDLPWVGKLVLILEMWMGRLEILPVLILFAPLFGSRKK